MGNQLKLCGHIEKKMNQIRQYSLVDFQEAQADNFLHEKPGIDKKADPLQVFLKKTILPIKTFQDLTQNVQMGCSLISPQDEIFKRVKDRAVRSAIGNDFQEESKLNCLSFIQEQIQAILEEKSINGQLIQNAQIDRGHLFKRLKINLGNFIRKSGQNIKNHYIFKQCVGEGSYGRVFRAICKKTKEQRAIKVLKKKHGIGQAEKSNFLAQFQLLSELDHPNVVKMYQIYYFKSHYYVVMEYCQGGSLIDWIKKTKSFSEGTICCIMKQLLSVLAYLHKQGIAHRDIKLDNIVVMNSKETKETQYLIKLIDFGTALRVSDKKVQIAGTWIYMSPQSFRGKLNVKADVWAAGILMYVMIAGKFPFNCHSLEDFQPQVNTKLVSFANYEWRQISKQAKKLLMRMLQRNPEKRVSATQALSHPWFEKNHLSFKKITWQQSNLSMLQKYQRGNNFIAVIEHFLCMRQISQKDRDELGSFFRKLDTNNDGVIQHSELVEICQDHFGVQTDNEVQRILQQIDHNGSGQIDFNEFLVAMYSRKRLFLQESLTQAFKFYDLDNDGYLQRNEIIILLQGCENEEVQYLLSEIDTDQDQKVSFQEFLAYLNKSS